jgi:hypothetical protein
MKMLGVGLGKAPGAGQIHRERPGEPMAEAIREIAEALIGTGRVLGGLAMIENAYDETARIVAIPPERIPDEEVALFGEAQSKPWRQKLGMARDGQGYASPFPN